MNYRYILMLAIILLPFMISCDDDDEDSYLPELVNVQRVREIKGHQSHWGDFKMECYYTEHFLDSAVITDAAGNKTGLILSTYGEENTIDVFDLLKLENTDAFMRRRIFSKTYIKNDRGQITETVERYYGPTQGLQTGDFDFYEEKKAVRNIFEYDEKGRMIICRCPEPLYKQMFSYDGMRLTGVEHYTIVNGEWVLSGEESFSYDNNKFASMKFSQHGSEAASWKYNWIDDRLVSIEMNGNYGAGTRTYKYDEKGFVTSLVDGEERFEIVYETGNGNFGMLSSFMESYRGVPCIR